MRRLGAYQTWLVYQAAESFAFRLTWTIAPIYFVLDVGMSPLELVLAGTVFEVAYFVFEVPTGVVADTYSRRVSVIVAQLVMGVGFIVTGAVESVGIILAAQALIGFGWTFKSGAVDAWLADEIGQQRLGGAYQRGAQAARIAGLVAIGVAVGLAVIDLRLPIVLGGVATVALGAFLAVAMPETAFEPARREELSAARSMVTTARHGSGLIRGHSVLMLITAITLLRGMSDEGFDRLWEAHLLVDVGVPDFAGLDPVLWFGVLNAAAVLLAILVAQPLVGRFERLSMAGMARLLLGLELALVGAMLVFALAGGFALAVAAFWAVRVAYSLEGPVFMTWLNGNITESRARATVISMTNVGHSVGESGGGPMVGLVGNVFGIRAALATGALVLTSAVPLYARAIRHHGREPELGAVLPAPVD
jgi:DHA3 family tetracycline resistance protein-like MFS transporter